MYWEHINSCASFPVQAISQLWWPQHPWSPSGHFHVCVYTCVCRVHARVLLNPLSNSQNKHERSQRTGEEDCVEVSLANFMLYSRQYQTVLKTAVFPLTFPTSCYQLAPSNMSCLFLHWLFGFHSGRLLCSIFTFSSVWAISKTTMVYEPQFSLTISPLLVWINVYIDTEMCSLTACCHFKVGYSPASLPNCLKVNGPVRRVYTEGVCEQSLWLHHTNNSKKSTPKEQFCMHKHSSTHRVTLTHTLSS